MPESQDSEQIDPTHVSAARTAPSSRQIHLTCPPVEEGRRKKKKKKILIEHYEKRGEEFVVVVVVVVPLVGEE